ncbi:hypothetical protein B296_00037668 [Ensete ventricosum]|uniref:Uncharacterized protein n=1 Tax=Ensete ventricosum TaxID=4639 RepID=A0A426Y8E5_ENSVE|nr:hypothetical protein B296_00037668 [Ensete ventricosum]
MGIGSEKMNSLKSWVAEHKLTSIGEITTPCARNVLVVVNNFVPRSRRCCVGFCTGIVAGIGSKEVADDQDEPSTHTCQVCARCTGDVLSYLAAVSCSPKGESIDDSSGELRSCATYRMHAQALTLAVLSSAALLHYYDTDGKIAMDDGENVTRNSLA